MTKSQWLTTEVYLLTHSTSVMGWAFGCAIYPCVWWRLHLMTSIESPNDSKIVYIYSDCPDGAVIGNYIQGFQYVLRFVVVFKKKVPDLMNEPLLLTRHNVCSTSNWTIYGLFPWHSVLPFSHIASQVQILIVNLKSLCSVRLIEQKKKSPPPKTKTHQWISLSHKPNSLKIIVTFLGILGTCSHLWF